MSIHNSNSIFQQLDLSALKYFVAVSTYGGFSKAARATGISQPALSVGVKRLEETLGTSLIERDSKSFSLTPSGVSILAFCQQLETSLETVIADLKTSKLAVQRRLRIGTGYSIGFSPLIALCQEAARMDEPLELELSAQSSYELISALKEGQLDAAVLPDDVHDSSVRFRHLLDDRVTFVVSPGYEKLFRHGDWRSAISKIPLLTYPRETRMRALIDEINLKHRLRYRTSFSVNGLEALKSLAVGEAGCAFVMRSLVESELKSGQLVEPELPIRFPKRGIHLATRPDRAGEQIEELLTELMKKYAA